MNYQLFLPHFYIFLKNFLIFYWNFVFLLNDLAFFLKNLIFLFFCNILMCFYKSFIFLPYMLINYNISLTKTFFLQLVNQNLFLNKLVLPYYLSIPFVLYQRNEYINILFSYYLYNLNILLISFFPFSNILFLINSRTYPMLFIPQNVFFYKFLPPKFIHQFSLALTTLLLYNSLYFFKYFLQIIWEFVPIKNHTSVTWFLRRFFRTFFTHHITIQNTTLSSLFFSIKISGKVGVTGNARRRKFKYYYGLKKKKILKNIFETLFFKKKFFLLYTSTGVLGVWVIWCVNA